MQMQVESRGNKGEKMSLVIAAISKDNDIIVCGDSRIVDKNSNIVTENENKIYQISDKVVIAYAGSKNDFDCLKIYLEIKSILLDTNDVECIYKEVKDYEENHASNDGIHLLIVGFNKCKIPQIYLIGTEKHQCRISKLLPINYMAIGDYDFDLFVDTQKDFSNIINDMKIIINDRAKVNNNVNTNITKQWECMALAETADEQPESELKASESIVHNAVHFDRGAGLRTNMERHTKEIKKAANYMRGKKKKNEFEQIALGAVDTFFREADEASRNINSKRFDERFDRMEQTNELVHGSYNYHNVFLDVGNGGNAVTNFEKCHNDCQVADLYQFLRKVMEKHDWNINVAYRLVDEYDRLKPLEDDDIDMLVTLLSFPEKFWKIINQYYNAGKAWVPAKNIDKLKIVIEQNMRRRELIDKMCGM